MAGHQQQRQQQSSGGTGKQQSGGHGSSGAHTDTNAPPYDITARTSEVSHMTLIVPLLALLFLSGAMAFLWGRFGSRYAPAQQQMSRQYQERGEGQQQIHTGAQLAAPGTDTGAAGGEEAGTGTGSVGGSEAGAMTGAGGAAETSGAATGATGISPAPGTASPAATEGGAAPVGTSGANGAATGGGAGAAGATASPPGPAPH